MRETTSDREDPRADAHGDAGARRKQAESWDEIALSMPDLFPAPSTQYYRRREIALIERCIGDLEGKRVLKLDLWNEAFNTRILQWMKHQGADTYGLDGSRVVTWRAHGNSGSERIRSGLVRADIRDIPFPDDSFDFVYAMGTIEHIDEYEIALSEVRRVLRRGGKAIIGVPHKWDPFLRPAIVSVLEFFGRYPYGPEKSFGYRSLRDAVEGQGLRVSRRSGILAIPGAVRLLELFFFSRNIPLYHLSSLVLRPFEILEARWGWASRLGYLVVVVAAKGS